ncbi:Sulfatase N-terminal, partial [Trinorchestia longiramus]
SSSSCLAPDTKPHIVFILADDMGYYDTPWHNPLVRAPALKTLADEGVTLEQAYMLPVCSPSRAALLTGRYPHT